MKKILFPILTIVTMFAITGCPTGAPYPLGTPGTEKINKNILGSWSQSNTELEVLKMDITKFDDYTVLVTVNEKGSLYSEDVTKFKGWFTEVEGKSFIYLQDIDDPKAQYYTYCYTLKGNTLTSFDISLKVGGIDAVTSTEAYRKEVSASLQFEDALSSEARWTK